MEPARAAKQVIVIRSDLKMRRGKEIAQGAHASMAWLRDRLGNVSGWPVLATEKGGELFEAGGLFSEAERAWMEGSYAKITCRVRSEQDLVSLFAAATDAGLVANLVEDAGRTEFHGDQVLTALAIGPDWADLIDPVTGELELY